MHGITRRGWLASLSKALAVLTGGKYMSKTGPRDDGQTYEVQDDGDVDAKMKKRIIDARNRVDDTEEYLYVKAPVEQELQANSAQQDIYYGMMVKQFLRTIEPILRSDELDNSDYYYEEVQLGAVELVPQESGGVPFDEYVIADLSPVKLKLRYDLADHAELPQEDTEPFTGLKSLIETNGIASRTWTVPKDDGSVVRTSDEQVVPKEIYEAGLREADEFLQSAGIGIEVNPQTGDAGFSYGDLTQEPPE